MSQNSHATPYANLTPDRVLDAVESLGLHSDARIYPLNSYENRVYQVGIEGSVPIIANAREGLTCNVGHGMLGWTLAMGSGEQAVALAMGEHDVRPWPG